MNRSTAWRIRIRSLLVLNTRIDIMRSPGVWPVSVQKITKYRPSQRNHTAPPANACRALSDWSPPSSFASRSIAPPVSTAIALAANRSITNATTRVTRPA